MFDHQLFQQYILQLKLSDSVNKRFLGKIKTLAIVGGAYGRETSLLFPTENLLETDYFILTQNVKVGLVGLCWLLKRPHQLRVSVVDHPCDST